jgi:hypothetical protein
MTCNLEGAGDACILRVLVMPSYRSIQKKYYVLSTYILLSFFFLILSGYSV